MCPLDINKNNDEPTLKPLSLSSISNGGAEPLLVASIELRSMVGFPGPSLRPVVRFIVHAPTDPLYETQFPVTQPPTKTPVSDAPLLSSSSTVAIAFETKPAANSGAAASAI